MSARLLLPLLAFLAATATAPPAQAQGPAQPAPAARVVPADIPPLERAPGDLSELRRLVLPNGIPVLLVSDPRLNKSSAALAVGVGSLADPPQREGMAHFLEHMLFLGTRKFPDVSAFDGYLTSNGGSNNAYTARDCTNYFFEIRHEAFEGALDRFAQFFIDPLFDPGFTERELNAVDAEHQMNIENDDWRAYALRAQVLRPGHPARQFSVGSRQTLAGTTREELLAWYAAHYSANRMTLVLMGRASLDQLERWAQQHFAAIPNRELPPVSVDADVLPRQAALRELRMEPVTDQRVLSLSFPLPDLRRWRFAKPAESVVFVLGHEGEGSLLAALKAEGLATGLVASTEAEAPSYGWFDIRIDLTPKGLEQAGRVKTRVFAAIDRLRREGIPPRLFAERRTMAQLTERWRDRGEGMGRAAELASLLLDHPLEVAERVPFLWLQPDPQAVAEVLAHLVPDNLLVTRIAKGLPVDRTAPHYGTRYAYAEDGGPAYQALVAAQAVPAIVLPAPNPFVPTATPLRPAEPARLVDEPALVVHHLQDQVFQRPLVAWVLRWQLPRDRASLRTAVLLRFHEACVREVLNETAYTAGEAGLGQVFSASLDGVQLTVEGYDASAGRLLDAALPHLGDCTLSPARFEALKDRLLRELAAFERADAHLAVRESRQRLVREFHWRADEQLPLARELTLAELRAFARGLLARGRLQVLVHGNLGAAEAVTVARGVAARIKTQAVAEPALLRPRTLVQRPGETLRAVERLATNNSAWRGEWVLGPDTAEGRAAAAVLASFIGEPFYTELRTRQQLGYIVGAGTSEDLRQLLLTAVVQSATTPADELESRGRAFLAGLPQRLRTLPDTDWQTLVDGVRDSLREQDRTIAARASRLATLAFYRGGDWGRREATLAALDGLSRERLAAQLAQALDPAHGQARSLLGYGRDHRLSASGSEGLDEVQRWKRSRRYE